MNGKVIGISFFITLALWAVVWAVTTDEIWRNIYDAANHALRVNQVLP